MSKYIGSELELFQNATNWKQYYGEKLKPFISGDVLEVGAGMGGTSKFLINKHVKSWAFLEPDEELLNKIKSNFTWPKPLSIDYINGYSSGLANSAMYDTIIYIDVLEHIKDDYQELDNICKHVRPGGHIVTLSPAFLAVYNDFDRQIGHFRRYDMKMISVMQFSSLKLKNCFYLDSIGLMASFINKYFLKQSLPSNQQIKFWDSYIIPVSKVFDNVLSSKFGKSIVAIWEKI